MTERAWMKLKPGDMVMNKRSPGIVLTVKKRGGAGLVLTDRTNHETIALDVRYKEFARYLPQERLPL